jgi:mutator protein MutT
VAVGAVIVDDGGRVCLVRRGRAPMAGRWSLPGGRVERGESLHDALRRELVEETGLAVEIGPLVEVVEIVTEGQHYVVLDYACRLVEGHLRAGGDADEVLWVPLERLSAHDVTEAVARVARRALSMLLS